MANLLWMMASCRFMDLTESDAAHLATAPVTYYDVFAYLMAKRLRSELEAGIAHFYVAAEDDLRAVRGRINISEQITRNWNRMDRIACQWDEFTPDIPLNRLFKCTCRLLQARVTNPAAIQVLSQCCDLLDDVTDVEPRVALSEIRTTRWHRANDRFRDCFDMAVRLLAGTGYEMGVGSDKSFVFLIDMNGLFEAFAGAVVEASFGVSITAQVTIGNLFNDPECINQRPDFLWKSSGLSWVGDAKYKILAADGRADALVKFWDLQPNDVRQLTVYAEMRHRPEGKPPSIALLYPFVGDSFPPISPATSWNGSPFWLVPVRVTRPPDESTDIRHAMPTLARGMYYGSITP
jgi:5-methylcytosine-specific restriction enzyme subunit McrC